MRVYCIRGVGFIGIRMGVYSWGCRFLGFRVVLGMGVQRFSFSSGKRS